MNVINYHPGRSSRFTRRITSVPALALLACTATLTPASSWAQSTWIGGTSTDWSDPSNWSSGVPASVNAIVNTSSGNLATVATDVTGSQPNLLRIGDGAVGTLNVQSGGNLTVAGETWIGNGSGIGTIIERRHYDCNYLVCGRSRRWPRDSEHDGRQPD